MLRSEVWRNFDFWLLGSVAILTIFGIAMIRSAIAGNLELIELDIVTRQIVFAAIGFGVILITAAMDYHLWVTISRILYVAIAIFLVLVIATGGARFGAARWIDVGLVLIQPSELAKITLIVVLADFFARNKERIKELLLIGRSVLPALGLIALILFQPDLSTSIVLFVIWFILLWATGLEFKYLLLFIGLGILLVIVGFPFLETYQKLRLVNFILPDPEARYGAIYNVNQSLIAIGNGGLLGQGYGQGSQVQLRFLKVRHIDFIFSAIAEEFGFIGALVIMLLLLFVILRCFRAARLANDTFGALIAYGVAAMLGFHALINIGMNLSLLPVTGLSLPFISYGGSSLLSFMLGIGLVESIIARSRALIV